jgi:putative ABC transport system permease protein
MLQALVRLISLRHLRRSWGRAALSLLGVIVGVSTFIFAPTLGATIAQSARNAVDDVGGRAVLEARGETDAFAPDVLQGVRNVPGVQAAAPLSNGGGLILGQSELIVFFGIDPALDREVRTYEVAQGDFLSSAGGLMLSERYAREKGYAVGDTLRLLGPGGLHDLTLVGTLAERGVARLNGGDMAVMDLDDAASLRGSRDLDSIAIIPTEGVATDALTTALQVVVPEGVTVEPPITRNRAADQFQGVINTLMLAVSLTLLALGSMLIYNTQSVSVAQRRAEIGLLRALGVSRRGVQGVFLLEAGGLGLIGSLLGIGLGYLLVSFGGSLPVIPQSSSTALTSTADIVVPAWLPPIALLVGVAIPVLAGYLPSRAASQVDPVEALSGTRAEANYTAFNRRQLVIGLVLMVLSLALASVSSADINSVPVAFVSAYLMLGGGILFLPPLLVALGGLLPGVMARAGGVTGMIAAGNLTRRPKRMAATAIVIMLAVWAGAQTTGSNFGYHTFVEKWSATENAFDLTMVGAGRNPFSPSISIPAQVVESIRARPEVAGVVAERLSSVIYEGNRYTLRAVDMAALRENGGGFVWSRGDEATAYRTLQTRPSMLTSGMLTFVNNMNPGKLITLETPSGAVDFEVVGGISGIVVDTGLLVMDRAIYQQLWQDDRVDRLQIRLQPGADVQAVRRDLLRDYALSGAVVLDNREMTAAFQNNLASISTVSQMMSSLLVFIIVGGLSTTLLVSVLDRQREIGMLRAVGMLRRQITAGIVLEALLLVAIGVLLGLPLGLFTAEVTARILHNMLGINMDVAPIDIVITLLIVVATVTLAAYFPARKAGATNVLEAMRYE